MSPAAAIRRPRRAKLPRCPGAEFRRPDAFLDPEWLQTNILIVRSESFWHLVQKHRDRLESASV